MSLHEERCEDEVVMSEPTCHMLPCSIDYSGRLYGAKTLFQPVPIVEQHHDDNGNGSDKSARGIILAATLRGRGLLGQEWAFDSSSLENDQEERSTAEAAAFLRVFKVGEKELSVEGPAVKKIVDWQHEHNPANLATETKSRLATAQAWLEVSHALHQPLPAPEIF